MAAKASAGMFENCIMQTRIRSGTLILNRCIGCSMGYGRNEGQTAQSVLLEKQRLVSIISVYTVRNARRADTPHKTIHGFGRECQMNLQQGRLL